MMVCVNFADRLRHGQAIAPALPAYDRHGRRKCKFCLEQNIYQPSMAITSKRARPPGMAEVQILHGAKICPHGCVYSVSEKLTHAIMLRTAK